MSSSYTDSAKSTVNYFDELIFNTLETSPDYAQYLSKYLIKVLNGQKVNPRRFFTTKCTQPTEVNIDSSFLPIRQNRTNEVWIAQHSCPQCFVLLLPGDINDAGKCNHCSGFIKKSETFKTHPILTKNVVTRTTTTPSIITSGNNMRVLNDRKRKSVSLVL